MFRWNKKRNVGAITETAGPTHPEPEFIHLVAGFRESLVDFLTWLSPRLFRLAHRSLCGVVLWGDPDKPEPPPGSTLCPKCVEIDGRDPEFLAATVKHEPGYWL